MQMGVKSKGNNDGIPRTKISAVFRVKIGVTSSVIKPSANASGNIIVSLLDVLDLYFSIECSSLGWGISAKSSDG